MTRTVIFITGTGHSGSTLLSLILGSHSEAFDLGELKNARLGDRDRVCYVCDGPCPFWDTPSWQAELTRRLTPGPLGRLRGAVAAWRSSVYDAAFRRTETRVLVDSSKSVSWFRRQLQYPRQWRDKTVRLVWVTRDGRAVVNSYLRKYPDRSVEELTEEWRRDVGRFRAFYESFPAERRARVAYEALATAPEATVRTLCADLGLDFEPAMLRYWEHDHHTVSGNTGTRSLIQRYRRERGEAADQGALDETQRRHGSHYEALGLDIRLDLRWVDEMTEDQKATFEALAGEDNAPFAFNP